MVIDNREIILEGNGETEIQQYHQTRWGDLIGSMFVRSIQYSNIETINLILVGNEKCHVPKLDYILLLHIRVRLGYIRLGGFS